MPSTYAFFLYILLKLILKQSGYHNMINNNWLIIIVDFVYINIL